MEVDGPDGLFKISFQAHLLQHGVGGTIKYLEGEPKEIGVWYGFVVQVETDYSILGTSAFQSRQPRNPGLSQEVDYIILQKESEIPTTYTINSFGDNFLQDYQSHSSARVDIRLVLVIRSNPTDIDQPSEDEPLTLQQKFENNLFQDHLSDLKIVCEDKEFPVHKFILSVRSDVFKTMFSTFNEDKLKIEDTNPKTMETFLRFLYTDSFKCCTDLDCNLLMLADKYNVKELVQNCVQALENHMTCENVLEIAYSAYLINDQKLIAKASEFILNNRGGI